MANATNVFSAVVPKIRSALTAAGTNQVLDLLLRIYLPDELRALVSEVPNADSFEWDIGTMSLPGLGIGLTHLVGIPKPGAG